MKRVIRLAGPMSRLRTIPASMLLHYGALAAALPLLIYLNRNQWFFGDEWAFITDRGITTGENGSLAPHNEHWSTIPILIYRGLFALFGIRSYVPYVTVLVLFHLLTTHFLWRVMGRAGVTPFVGASFSVLFLFLGGGAENLLWAFQIGFVGSVLLGLVQLWLVAPAPIDKVRETRAIAVAVISLAFSGISVPFVAVATIARAFTAGWRAAVRFAAIPAVVYVGWFTAFGAEATATSNVPSDVAVTVPQYIWRGIVNTVGETTGVPALTIPLLAALAAWIFVARERVVRAAAGPLAAVIGLPAFFAMLAIGRAGLGVEQAEASRYVYIAAAMLLPLVAVAFSDLSRRVPGATIVSVALVGAATVHGFHALGDAATTEARREASLQGQIFAGLELALADEPLLRGHPDPVYSPNLEISELVAMSRGGVLPEGIQPSTLEKARAAAYLQVSLTDAPARASSSTPPRLGLLARVTTTSQSRDCLTFAVAGSSPQILTLFPQPATVTVRPETAGELRVFMHDEEVDVTTEPVVFPVDAGSTYYLNVSAGGSEPIIEFPPSGETVVCGLVAA